MKNTLQLYASVFLVLFSIFRGNCQVHDQRLKSVSFISGFGFHDNTATPYKPLFLAANFDFRISRRQKNDSRSLITWYSEPQFNLVFTRRRTDFELGANFGFRHSFRLSPQFYFYQMIGTGPHFFSASETGQANGFIFSDNISAGFFKQVSRHKPVLINVKFQFRHMSNASIKWPNPGINNFNLLVGIIKIKPAHDTDQGRFSAAGLKK